MYSTGIFAEHGILFKPHSSDQIITFTIFIWFDIDSHLFYKKVTSSTLVIVWACLN